MSTQDIKALDGELNKMILSGQAMEAFEKFYADDVVMQETAGAHFTGKDVNRQREIDFFSSIEQFHGAELLASGIGDNASFGEWLYDITFKRKGRVKMEQVSVRRWKDGKVVRERFYYESAH
jgi:ketosteroid isomerase-like protein